MFAVFFHGTSDANCVRNGSVMLIMLCSGKPDLSETCWLCGSKITETSVEAKPRLRKNFLSFLVLFSLSRSMCKVTDGLACSLDIFLFLINF